MRMNENGNRVVDLEQGSQQWLDFRKTRLGASDIPIIMGESPWCTPYQLWCQKLDLVPSQSENFAMSEGKRMEPVIRQMIVDLIGEPLTPLVAVSLNNDRILASVDAITETHKRMYEIKYPSLQDHEYAMDGTCPKKYYGQLQAQMYVFDLIRNHYSSYHPQDELRIVPIDRDETYIQTMIEMAEDFLECLDTLTPPPMTDRDFFERYDNDWKTAALEYQLAEKIMTAAAEKKEVCRKALIALAGESNTTGEGIRLSRTIRRGAVDYSAIEALKEIDLEQYRKPSISSWRIDIKKQGEKDERSAEQ